ncbi:MAG TPA: ATP-binding cassette domain-containing protein, partial [Thermomicrobiales bacterium]|nr:ATP-binding cassette domain-containing protein [Thermomicrobiales bacterium]
LRGDSPRAARSRALELLEAVGLADKVRSPIEKLSAGQCQRVALARALAAEPEVVLADEPTASLDAQNGQEAMRLLRRLTAEQGKAALVVTHDQRILAFADRVLRLDAGHIAAADERFEAPGSAALHLGGEYSNA